MDVLQQAKIWNGDNNNIVELVDTVYPQMKIHITFLRVLIKMSPVPGTKSCPTFSTNYTTLIHAHNYSLPYQMNYNHGETIKIHPF